MQRFILVVYLTAFATIAPVVAQPTEEVVHSTKGVEIGTLFGLSHFPADDMTIIGIPTTFTSLLVPTGNPSLYVSWFPSERLAIGPEFSFGVWSGDLGWSDDNVSDGEERATVSITTLYFGGRGAFFSKSNTASGPYLLGKVALLGLYAAGSSLHAFSAGAGLGRQWRVGPDFVLRMEGRYRRWVDDGDEFNDLFGDGENEFSLFVGLGTRFSR